ncbi:MAG: hypothetical protein EXQ59_03735 [Acidobacteria bacterium]|nr:hypothetical protein [Acidobacteriota bacterium]
MAQTGRFFVLAVLTASVVFGYDASLDRRAIEDAITIGQSRIESVRVRFHQAYRLPVGRAPVDYIEVVTPFRRIEVEAETRARNGNRTLSQREALDLLGAAPDQVEFFVELTFHPQNTYIGVPQYGVRLAPAARGASPPIDPRNIERFPRYGARVHGLPLPYPAAPAVPGSSEPVLGGTLVARFDGRLLDRTGVYDVIVSEAGKELATARVSLANVR